MLHQPPPNAIPKDTTPTQPKEGKKSITRPVEKTTKNVVQIGNKVSLHVGSQAKDKGQSKALDSDSESQQKWQNARKKST